MTTFHGKSRSMPSARAAFTLSELISTLVVVVFVLTLVTQVVHTHFDTNRRLTASAGRAAATQSFLHQIRGDLLAAASFTVAASTSDANLITTTATIDTPDGAVTYTFSRVDHTDLHADREPGVDQVIVRTDADGVAHRWTLSSQTVVVQPSPAAPKRILTLAFEDNGPRTVGFIRHERLELSLLVGGSP